MALALLLPTLLGWLCLAALLGRETEDSFLERLSLSFPLGMGLVTAQMFALGLLRVPLTLWSTALPVAAEAALLALWAARRGLPLWPAGGTGRAGTRGWGFLTSALAVWAAAKLVSVWVETGTHPLWAWDTWYNWSAGAKVFYHARGLLLDAPPEDFFGRAVSRSLAYPLHNPLMQVWVAQWAGRFDDVLVKFTTPLMLSSVCAHLYALASRETSRTAALALLVAFLGSPLLSYHAVEVYSDLPLGAYLMFASAAFLKGMRGARSYWPLVGLFCAQAVFTKDEAVFFVVPLLLSCALHLRRAREPGFAAVLAGLSLAAPWAAFKALHGLGLGADDVAFALAFHPENLLDLAGLVLSLANFGVVFVLLPALALAAGKPTLQFLHLLAPSVCFALFYLALYTFTAAYGEGFRPVLFRNMLTGYPTCALLAALLLGRAYFRRSLSALR